VTSVENEDRGATGGPARELRALLDRIMPAYRERWGTERTFEAALAWQRLLAEDGWAAPSWPTDAGGRGLGVLDRVECDLELAQADAPAAAGVLGLQNIGPALSCSARTSRRRPSRGS
jgi:alkylation response protein AidB-like acyl-CoA dehydrogenase